MLSWYSEALDPDIANAISKLGLVPGKVLDIGCGDGAQTMGLAALGWQAVGIDISAKVVKSAERQAQKRGFYCQMIY